MRLPSRTTVISLCRCSDRAQRRPRRQCERKTRKPTVSSTDVVVIPNFVDNNWLTPVDGSPYRDEFGLGDGPIVMYAGNLGYSQSLDLMIDLAEQRPEITVVINGDGDAGHRYRGCARLSNLHHIGYQPAQRLPEVLSAADIHVVPLRTGLGSVSVPSKTYSILAVGKPVIAAIDEGSAVARLLADANAGVSIPPEMSERSSTRLTPFR